MIRFKIGDIVRCDGTAAARMFMKNKPLDCDTTTLYVCEVTDYGEVFAKLNKNDLSHFVQGPAEHFTLVKTFLPKPKRKGYALWIYNIEKQLKKGHK